MDKILLCDGEKLLILLRDGRLLRYDTSTHQSKFISSGIKKKEPPALYTIDRANNVVYYIKNGILYIITLDTIKAINLPSEEKSDKIASGDNKFYIAYAKRIFLFKNNKWHVIYETKQHDIVAITAHPMMEDIYICLGSGWVLCGTPKNANRDNFVITTQPIIYQKNILNIRADPISRNLLLHVKMYKGEICLVTIEEGGLYVLYKLINSRNSGAITPDDEGDNGFRYDGPCKKMYTPGIGKESNFTLIPYGYIILHGNNYEIAMHGSVLMNGCEIGYIDISTLYYGNYNLYGISEHVFETEEKKNTKQIKKRNNDKKYVYTVEKFNKCRYCGGFMKYRCIYHLKEYKMMAIGTMCKIAYNTDVSESGFGIDSIVCRIMLKYM
jgi:hypothetical protein